MIIKYKLLKNSAVLYRGIKLYRIVATKDFGLIKEGTLGGYIEHERNLSQKGNCWLHDIPQDRVLFSLYVQKDIGFDGAIFENGHVSGDAQIICSKIYGNCQISGNADIQRSEIKGEVTITGNAFANRILGIDRCKIYGNAQLSTLEISGDSEVYGNTDIYKVDIKGGVKLNGYVIRPGYISS